MAKKLVNGMLITAGLGCILPPSASAKAAPNVVFILADDMGWGDLGCYGNPHVKTPNLDRLAGQGMLLENFYVSAPVCSPSRAAFMTGRYPISVGLPHIIMAGAEAKKYGSVPFLDPGLMTVTRLFQRAGYKTGHFGKWHLGSRTGPQVADYGIDENTTAGGNGPQLPLYESKTDEGRREFRGRSSELIIDAAMDFIERHKAEPFYINVWSIVPHSPLAPTDRQLAAYPNLRQPRFIPHTSSRHIYYAAVTDLDHQIGRLLDRLDALGLGDNTIVVFSSDNGPENELINNAGYSASGSTGPFRGCKRSLYDGGIRVPFIARWPGKIPAGAVNERDVVAGMDWLPTAAALCGLEVSSDGPLDGEDCSPALLGRTMARKAPVMWEWRSKIYAHRIHQSPRFALRDGPWKFLTNPGGARQELYFVADDPSEMNNLAAAHPERVARYARLLREFAEKMPQGPVQPGAGEQDLFVPRTDRQSRGGH
jgi:N-acetylgalactosamine-6-sulfatase